MHWLRTNAHAVVVAFQGNILAQAPMPQLDEAPELLRPIPRDSTPDSKDAEPLLPQQSGREVLKIEKGIEPDLVTPGGFAQPVVECDVQPKFRIRKRRHKHRY